MTSCPYAHGPEELRGHQQPRTSKLSAQQLSRVVPQPYLLGTHLGEKLYSEMILHTVFYRLPLVRTRKDNSNMDLELWK